VLSQGAFEGRAADGRGGYVLGPREGEHLVHFCDHGDISIKLGSATGSENLAFGHPAMVDTGIPIPTASIASATDSYRLIFAIVICCCLPRVQRTWVSPENQE
jgi:hypothetical protein